MTNYLSRGLKGLFFIFTFTFLAYLTGYVTRTLLARNLETSQFGLFYAVYTLIMFATIFAYFGFGAPLVKYIVEFKAKKKYEKLTFSIFFPTLIMASLAIIISIFLFLSSNFLAINFFKTLEALFIIRLFSIVMILTVIFHTLNLIFKGFQDFFFVGLSTFFGKFSFTIFVILFLLLGFEKNVYLPTYAILFGFVLTILLFLPRLLKYKGYFRKIKFSSDLAKKIKNFAFASFLASIGLLIIGYVDTLMLTYFRSLEEVGIYNVVLPTVMVLSMFTQSVRSVLAPMVSELWAKNLKERLSNGIKILRDYSLVLIVPMILVLFVFPKPIITLLFGAKYVSGYLAMQILSIGIVFFTIGFMDIIIIRFIGKPKETTKIIFIAVIFNVIANLILIPLFGINGAAITTTLSYFIVMILSSVKLNHFVKVKSSLSFWFKVIFAAVFFVITVAIVKALLNINQFVEAAICLILATAVYLGICYMLNLIKIKEVKLFLRSFLLRK
ncbi:MAG: flippase [Nanoarchaeota archaeon]|nr:flippase [Nanoarchaeota archaeon]